MYVELQEFPKEEAGGFFVYVKQIYIGTAVEKTCFTASSMYLVGHSTRVSLLISCVLPAKPFVYEILTCRPWILASVQCRPPRCSITISVQCIPYARQAVYL